MAQIGDVCRLGNLLIRFDIDLHIDRFHDIQTLRRFEVVGCDEAPLQWLGVIPLMPGEFKLGQIPQMLMCIDDRKRIGHGFILSRGEGSQAVRQRPCCRTGNGGGCQKISSCHK